MALGNKDSKRTKLGVNYNRLSPEERKIYWDNFKKLCQSPEKNPIEVGKIELGRTISKKE